MRSPPRSRITKPRSSPVVRLTLTNTFCAWASNATPFVTNAGMNAFVDNSIYLNGPFGNHEHQLHIRDAPVQKLKTLRFRVQSESIL